MEDIVSYLHFVVLPQFIDALIIGVAVALVALGLTMIFGLLDVINLAHGELYMLGGYAAFTLLGWGMGYWSALVLVPILVGFVGWGLEELGIRPLFVHRDDQVRGLTHLLTLALRVLTLFEVLVRRGQDQDGVELAGLYPGQAKRTTDRPTAKRVLETIARTGVTLIQEVGDPECRWHLTALPVLVKRVLGYLGLSDEVYTRLVINSG